MNTCIFSIVLFFAVARGSAEQDELFELRTWTDERGRTAELAFIEISDGKLRMRSKTGKEFILGLEQLSSDDQRYVMDTVVERAVSLKSDGRYGDAAALLESVIGVDPNYAPAFLWLGDTKYAAREWSAAAEAYKSYSNLVPSDLDGPRGAARAFLKQGNKEDLAKFWYKRALEIDPRNRELQAELDAIEEPRPPEPPKSRPTTSSRAVQGSAAGRSDSGPSTPFSPGEDTVGFWRQGLVGILGGRSIWWGRLIALGLFSIALVFSIVQLRWMYQSMQRGGMFKGRAQVGCSALIGGLLNFSILYILYWGIPTGWNWALMLSVVVVFSYFGIMAAVSE